MGYKEFDPEVERELDEMDLQDKDLTCEDDGQPFVFEAGEQRFLHRLVIEGGKDRNGQPMTYREPKRCRDCRAKRKAQREKV
jgi:ribosomal protein S6E (S10)